MKWAGSWTAPPRCRGESTSSSAAAARDEAARQRVEAERGHTNLAKVEMRLEAMPCLEADLATARAGRETEQRARIAAEQSAAVAVTQRDSLAERMAEDKARIDALLHGC